MNDGMKLYYVTWHTQISPGATYYDGVLKIWAHDPSGAIQRCQRTIHSIFPEYPVAHIIADDVSDIGPTLCSDEDTDQ